MKLFKYFTILVLLCCCKSNFNKLDLIYGEWFINNLLYKNDNLGFYNLHIDKNTNWLLLENKNSKTVKANYKLYYSKNREIFFDISNSTDNRFNGEYLIEIDTLSTSPQRDEIAVTFQSNNIYFKCYKNIVHKIGN